MAITDACSSTTYESWIYTNDEKSSFRGRGDIPCREEILKKLREQGDARITKQRQLLLDIILQEEYSCCKEIYYKAAKQDSSIGIATVYRMINTLEDIGAISRNTMYRIDCGDDLAQAKDNCEG
ncbi:MAG: transcriptional repressor [Clostridium sp.]